jgi:aryl-alcohol dehydrogenase-like predicted oxidoreductase
VAETREKQRLGLSPVEVVPLGVGCWSWGDREYWRYGLDHGPEDVVGAFGACLEAGLNFFDTAEAYAWGKGEQILGALARKSGRELVVATKYAPLAGRGGAAAIPAGLERSLRRLRIPSIDLYQIHWADREEAPIGPAMDALAEAVGRGQIRAVGVSNFRATEMREAHAALARHGIPLAVNQVKYSLLHRSPEVDGVLEACRELDVTLLAYSPLEQGLLTGKYSPAAPPPGKRAETPWFGADNIAAAMPVIARLREIGELRGVSTGAVALAWLLGRPGVIPLVGARTAAQAKSNAEALRIVLTGAEMEDLDRATSLWRVAE